MEVWVFSYNRGTFLQNCVASLEACLPPEVVVSVFDDDSDDPATQAVLAGIAKRHRVLRPGASALGSKHGGLYGNLQAVVDQTALEPRADIICCIQDDMQCVRPVTSEEVLQIEALFSRHPDLGFVQPAFLKGCNEAEDAPRTRFDDHLNGYVVDRFDRSAGAFYSDVFIASIGRLQARRWTFSARERENEVRAKALFGQMPHLRDPFVAWLPSVPAFRGKRQTWAMKQAQKQQRSGFYPIRILSQAETDQFVSRPTRQLPYAEHFLSLGSARVPTPWRYYPLQGRRLLKLVSRLELALRGW